MRYKKISISIGVLCLFGCAFVLYTNLVILSYQKNISHLVSQISTSTAIMVFGGGISGDGEVSDMAITRMRAGVDLYKAGRADKLVITGDDGEFRANEMTPMLAYARSNGVPASAIVVDGHGYRTYESCYRGARFYGFKNVIAVSQRFHLPRIIFLCEHFGLHTVGFVADDNLPLSAQIKIEIREVLARVKNWIDVVVLPPKSPVNNTLRSEP
jgi:vancomycin permeability regulator SanA